VTDSEKLTKKVGVSAGLYVALAGAETDNIVGAVRSMTIVVVAGETAAGPAVVPVTEFALRAGMRVPSEHEDIVTV
jgi:hypothetical protein